MGFKLYEIGGYIIVKFLRLLYDPKDFEFLESFGFEDLGDRNFVCEESVNYVRSVLLNIGFIEWL